MVLLTSQYALKSGSVAPDFELPGIDGKTCSLPKLAGHKALLIVFMCNHCPYVKPKMGYLAKLQDTYGPRGLQVVGINPNDPSAYPEDSVESMTQVAAMHHFHFPYLIDETQDVARAYGAVCTPDFFGYNADLKLQYRGRLDPTTPGRPAPKGARRELLEAMTVVARTGQGPKDQTPSQGCSIKWR